jgi:hypothetical protein
VADQLTEVTETIKSVAGAWSKYSAVGGFLLYVVGYLALRFHLAAIGVGTDLAVLDERYLFTGARFLVYLVSAVPSIVLVFLPVALLALAVRSIIPEAARASLREWVMRPARLAWFGIVCALVMIQFVMRQCFFFSDLLLAPALPPEPAWLARLLLADQYMPLYFGSLVAGCAVSLSILWLLRKDDGASAPFATALLIFLVTVQVLLLPVNYGVLIVDKVLPRVSAVGDNPLGVDEDAWLVWEGKDGVTFLVRSEPDRRRALVTLPREQVKRTEIVRYDRILPTLFGRRPGAKE